MANENHGALTAADGLHEPKGIENETIGKIYVSNGTGSGVWTDKNTYITPSYICVYLDQAEDTDRTFTLVDTILPFTLDYIEGMSSNFTYNNLTKDIEYTGTNSINVQFVASITLSKGVAGANTNMKFYIQKDEGAGFVTQLRTMAGDTLEDNYLSNTCVTCVGTLNTGDKVRMAVESSEAVTVTAENINITISGLTL